MSVLNRHRGDVALRLGDETLTLRLTLGALAELESAYQAAGLSDLAARLGAGRPASADLVRLLGVAVRGGGTRLDDETIAARVTAADLPAVAEALAELFALAFGSGADPRKPQEA